MLRYADDVIWDEAGLLGMLGYESANDIEDALLPNTTSTVTWSSG